ncbi:zinc finger, C3HC4 type (RING finger) protein, partial (macronuclear) [Tetrahymena thermophila SB210]
MQTSQCQFFFFNINKKLLVASKLLLKSYFVYFPLYIYLFIQGVSGKLEILNNYQFITKQIDYKSKVKKCNINIILRIITIMNKIVKQICQNYLLIFSFFRIVELVYAQQLPAYKYIQAKTITLSNEQQYLLVTLQLDAQTIGRNIIFGYTVNKNQLPASFNDLLSAGSAFDMNSYLAQLSTQQLYIDKQQLTNISQIYIYVILTDPNDGYIYSYTVSKSSSVNYSCPCLSNCSCYSHGISKCAQGYIGQRCEQQAQELSQSQTQYLIQGYSFFYFDATDQSKSYQLGISGFNNQQNFDLYVKYYNTNSSVIPYPQNSQSILGINQTQLNILANSALKSPPLYYNRVLIKIGNSNMQSFNVQISLDSTDQGSSSNNQLIVIILISVCGFVFILLVFTLIYIAKLNKRDRILQQQNRAQRQRNTQRLNTTMGEDDLKKYMPAVLYKEIKSQLLKVSKQQDVGNCVVCLCDFEDDENVRSTYCKHVFHSECLTDWMKKNESCPYCRTPLNKDNIEEIYDKYKYNSLVWLQQESDDEIKENSKMIGMENSKEMAKSDIQVPSNQIFIQSKSRGSQNFQNQVGSPKNINAELSNSQIQNKSLNDNQDIKQNNNRRISQLSNHRPQPIQINSSQNQNKLQNSITIENNKLPKKDDNDFVLEQQHQQELNSKRSNEEINFQSSENVQTINKFNYEGLDTPVQQISMSNTPGRENSIVQLRKSTFSKNDSFSDENKSKNQKVFKKKLIKNSNFKNQTPLKNLLDNTQTNADSSFNNDIKSFGIINQVVSIDQDSIYDDQ